MDNIDTAILDCLKENGRVTASEISIQKYTIKLDRRQTGQKLLAFIFVNIDKT